MITIQHCNYLLLIVSSFGDLIGIDVHVRFLKLSVKMGENVFSFGLKKRHRFMGLVYALLFLGMVKIRKALRGKIARGR